MLVDGDKNWLDRTYAIAFLAMHLPFLRPWVLLPFLWALPLSSPACINDYVPNKKAIAASRTLAEQLTKVELLEPWETRRDRLRKEVDAGADYKVRNDLASALMHTGDPKAAVQILEEIEKTNPGLYQTASNLGTAYELAGDNQKALEWINEGIRRNPHSHESSEWIHVKVLQAKLGFAGDTDPELPEGGSILGLNFGRNPQPEYPAVLPEGNLGESLTLDQIEAGLKHQLRERLQFVKPPDRIVASLLLDLANIIALKSGKLGTAQGIYEMAASYWKFEGGGESPSGFWFHYHLRYARLANQTRPLFPDPVGTFATLAIFVGIVLYVLLKIRDRRRRRVVVSA